MLVTLGDTIVSLHFWNVLYLQSWTKSAFYIEFCSFLPTDAFPTDPIPLWPLPLPHPGQCCSVKDRNDPTRLQHICFGEEWGSINFVCSAFKSFILKLNKATSFF